MYRKLHVDSDKLWTRIHLLPPKKGILITSIFIETTRSTEDPALMLRGLRVNSKEIYYDLKTFSNENETDCYAVTSRKSAAAFLCSIRTKTKTNYRLKREK